MHSVIIALGILGWDKNTFLFIKLSPRPHAVIRKTRTIKRCGIDAPTMCNWRNWTDWGASGGQVMPGMADGLTHQLGKPLSPRPRSRGIKIPQVITVDFGRGSSADEGNQSLKTGVHLMSYQWFIYHGWVLINHKSSAVDLDRTESLLDCENW